MARRGILGATIIVLLLNLGGCAATSERASDTETVATLRTSQGEITLRFFPEIAPEHVRNFIEHSRSGYYAGTTFHRVIPSFVIQGGDPNTKDDDPANDGMGGHSYKGEDTTLPPEFSDRLHLRGTLSMARAQAEDSAGSQFFICHAAAPFLDGKYTIFGEVIDGIEAVDKIVNVERDKRDRPLENQYIEGVIVDQWPSKKVEAARRAMLAEDGAQPVGEQSDAGAENIFWNPMSLLLEEMR